MLKKDLELKRQRMGRPGQTAQDDLEELFIDEIDFAIKKINDRTLFNSSQHEVERVVNSVNNQKSHHMRQIIGQISR